MKKDERAYMTPDFHRSAGKFFCAFSIFLMPVFLSSEPDRIALISFRSARLHAGYS